MWFVLQLTNIIITGNMAVFMLPRVLYTRFYENITINCPKLEIRCCSDGYNDIRSCTSVYTFKNHGASMVISKGDSIDTGSEKHSKHSSHVIHLDTVSPSIEKLLVKQYKSNTHLTSRLCNSISNLLINSSSNRCKYTGTNSNVNEFDIYFDEFDMLCDEERDRLVSERFEYLMVCLELECNFYKDLQLDLGGHTNTNIAENPGYAAIPPIDGAFIRDHAKDRLVGEQKYNISFASGGTKGAMKYVYRNTWEDSENARYIAKGLLVSGLRSHDTVVNTLSGGFWGGYHVYNLALQTMGCSLVPLGGSNDFAYITEFICNIRPTTVLCMPNWILSFVEYLEGVLAENATNGHDPSVDWVRATSCVGCIRKLVIGGEMLFQGGREKINRILVNIDPGSGFISTGYTSNETGVTAFRCPYATKIASQVGKLDSLPPDVVSSIPSGGYFHIHENMQYTTIQSLNEPPLEQLSNSNSNGGNTGSSSGMLITTNLNRTLMPMVKYATGDLCSIIHTDGVPYKCPCGRTLRTMVLYGRCDDRIRIAGEDIYVNEIAKVITMVPQLSMHFTIKLSKSYRLRDVIELHVEGLKTTNVQGPGVYRTIEIVLIDAFLQCCNTFKASFWNEECGIMEKPLLILYKMNTLPRNERTGKIPLCVDLRE